MASPPLPTAAESLVGVVASQESFKSLRCKAPWNKSEVDTLASSFEECFGASACDLLRSGNYAGGPIVQLGADLELHVTRQHVRQHASVIIPVLKIYNDRIPSAFLMADALVELNKRLNGQMLKPYPTNNNKPEARALDEGLKIKRMLQYLRLLFRASTTSRDPVLDEMKQLMVRKPKKVPELAGESPTSPTFTAQTPSSSMRLSSSPSMESLQDNSDILGETLQILGLPSENTQETEEEESCWPAVALDVEEALVLDAPPAVPHQRHKGKAKRKTKGKGVKGKASFKCKQGKVRGVRNPKSKQEGPKAEERPSGCGEMLSHVGLGLPEECYPMQARLGKYSYTLRSENGSVIEVLLKARAFWVKRAGLEREVSARSFTWKAHGSPAAAWEAAKLAAFWG